MRWEEGRVNFKRLVNKNAIQLKIRDPLGNFVRKALTISPRPPVILAKNLNYPIPWIFHPCASMNSFLMSNKQITDEDHWRNCETEELLVGIKNFRLAEADSTDEEEEDESKWGAAFVPTKSATSAVGIVDNAGRGKSKKSCKWRFVRRRWRCI